MNSRGDHRQSGLLPFQSETFLPIHFKRVGLSRNYSTQRDTANPFMNLQGSFRKRFHVISVRASLFLLIFPKFPRPDLHPNVRDGSQGQTMLRYRLSKSITRRRDADVEAAPASACSP